MLTRDIKFRLGCGANGQAGLKAHPFFASVDWEKLALLQVDPPYKPKAFKKTEPGNFDSDFTSEKAVLTPTDKRLIDSIDQREFRGFSFVNPTFKDS